MRIVIIKVCFKRGRDLIVAWQKRRTDGRTINRVAWFPRFSLWSFNLSSSVSSKIQCCPLPLSSSSIGRRKLLKEEESSHPSSKGPLFSFYLLLVRTSCTTLLFLPGPENTQSRPEVLSCYTVTPPDSREVIFNSRNSRPLASLLFFHPSPFTLLPLPE